MELSSTIPIEELRALLRCDEETGKLYWISKFSGREALTAAHGGYRRGIIRRRHYYAHRVVWALTHGAWPQNSIDHVNGDKSDNRPRNLREVEFHLNMKNQPMRHNNVSGHMGVHWNTQKCKWVARVNDGRSRIFLGEFEALVDAIAARRAAELIYGYHENHGRMAA